MKIIPFVLLGFLFSAEASINAGLPADALSKLIRTRCFRYLGLAEGMKCHSAVKKQMAILDYDLIFLNEKSTPGPFVFITFKKRLLQTLSEQTTSDYLKRINRGLNDHLGGKKANFNLWDETLAFYKSPSEAVEKIAYLFQDTSPLKLHIGYIQRSGVKRGQTFTANLELLSQVIDTMNLILDMPIDRHFSIFYPKDLGFHINRNLYHFYVPFYLAQELETNLINERFAYIAPLMLTMTYEFITSAKDFRYVLNDPERLSPEQDNGTIRDIFTAHAGASYGLGLRTELNFYEDLRQSFHRSTAEAVELLLNPRE